MGRMTDWKIGEFQEATGLRPATGAHLATLKRLQRTVAEYLEVLALEKSGIRDGDGMWHGGDPVEGDAKTIERLARRYAEGEVEEEDGPSSWLDWEGGPSSWPDYAPDHREPVDGRA